MAPERIDLTEVVEDVQFPCDFNNPEHDPQGLCSGSHAEWVLYFSCCRGVRPRLACSGCKDHRTGPTESAVVCGSCGEVYAPARKAYSRVEAL